MLSVAAWLAAPAAAQARVLMTQQEALALAFPGAPPERRTAYLTAGQVRRAEAAGRARVSSRVWTYYVGASSGGAAYAYFDTHVVRTMPETVMALLSEDGRILWVELLSFHEPEDYRARPRWLGQFKGKGLADGLLVGRALRNITGASLTSAALADGARRVAAVHAVLRGKETQP